MEAELLARLLEIEEVGLSGFSVRAGLTGSGVTLMRGRSFFGSWRMTAGTLVWSYAHVGENFFMQTAEDAVRQTMLIILKTLASTHGPGARANSAVA